MNRKPKVGDIIEYHNPEGEGVIELVLVLERYSVYPNYKLYKLMLLMSSEYPKEVGSCWKIAYLKEDCMRIIVE